MCVGTPPNRARVASMPQVMWDAPVDEHHALVATYIRAALADAFVADKREQRKSWISEGAWRLITNRKWKRWEARDACTEARTHLVATLFATWERSCLWWRSCLSSKGSPL